MKITRRQALVGGLAAAAVPLAESKALHSTEKADWQVWVRLEIDETPYVFGTIGKHACGGLNPFLSGLCMDDHPVHLAGPDTLVKNGAIAIDIPLLLARPGIVREIPDGWGFVLVVTDDRDVKRVSKAAKLVQRKALWTYLSQNPISSDFELPERLGRIGAHCNEVGDLAHRMIQYPEIVKPVRSFAKGRILTSGSASRPIEYLGEHALDAIDWEVRCLKDESEVEATLKGVLYHCAFTGTPIDGYPPVVQSYLGELRQAISPIAPIEIILSEPRESAMKGEFRLDEVTLMVWDV